MNYDLKSLAVANLFIVPKHFLVREIIEERKPLAATARRAGWIGSKILLDRVPESGKIHIVQGGIIRAKELVLADWQKTLFLRNESPKTRGCRSASATSRWTRSTPSSGTSAISIRATRTSDPRYASSFNICVTADLSISCRVVIIACGPKKASDKFGLFLTDLNDFVMAELVPAIHVFLAGKQLRRGCPAQGRA
jgi:hypothetical protein